MKKFRLLPCLLWLGVIAFLAGCGGKSSGTGANGGGASNPIPYIVSISQTSAPRSAASYALTVRGSGFVSGSKVQCGQSGLTTSYVSSSSLSLWLVSAYLVGMVVYYHSMKRQLGIEG